MFHFIKVIVKFINDYLPSVVCNFTYKGNNDVSFYQNSGFWITEWIVTEQMKVPRLVTIRVGRSQQPTYLLVGVQLVYVRENL